MSRTIRTLLELRRETECHFVVGTVILEFLTVFKKSQALLAFEALNSACLSSCQRYVNPLVEMRWRPRSFCRVSTGDSDILPSCDMNDEPALSLCREIQASLESGHLGVRFT